MVSPGPRMLSPEPELRMMSPEPPAIRPRLLGLTEVIDQIRLIFDGTLTPLAEKGILVVEKQ